MRSAVSKIRTCRGAAAGWAASAYNRYLIRGGRPSRWNGRCGTGMKSAASAPHTYSFASNNRYRLCRPPRASALPGDVAGLERLTDRRRRRRRLYTRSQGPLANTAAAAPVYANLIIYRTRQLDMVHEFTVRRR